MVDYSTLYSETKKLSVLLAEDFQPLRQEMCGLLENLFQDVTCAENGLVALHYYIEADESDKNKFDLIISDIQMPKLNGVNLSKEIRKYNPNQPIIILSAHKESKYLIEFINMGISKFLSKPLEEDNLISVLYDECKKINALKSKPIEEYILDFGEGCTWHRRKQLLQKDDEVIALSKYELLLLQMFLNAEGQLCSNAEISVYFLHKDIVMSEKNIRNHIFKLRQKIPKRCISSLYGAGYIFSIGNK